MLEQECLLEFDWFEEIKQAKTNEEDPQISTGKITFELNITQLGDKFYDLNNAILINTCGFNYLEIFTLEHILELYALYDIKNLQLGKLCAFF